MATKRKKPMTKAVKEGLQTIAGVIETGDCADFLGNDPDTSEETRRAWEQVEEAVAWIRENCE